MTEMSEKENESDDTATHTPPGTVCTLQETKVSRGARGLAPPGHLWLGTLVTVAGPLGVTEANCGQRDS